MITKTLTKQLYTKTPYAFRLKNDTSQDVSIELFSKKEKNVTLINKGRKYSDFVTELKSNSFKSCYIEIECVTRPHKGEVFFLVVYGTKFRQSSFYQVANKRPADKTKLSLWTKLSVCNKSKWIFNLLGKEEIIVKVFPEIPYDQVVF